MTLRALPWRPAIATALAAAVLLAAVPGILAQAPPPAPDLVIQRLLLPAALPATGLVAVGVVVSNQGNAPATGVAVTLEAADSSLGAAFTGADVTARSSPLASTILPGLHRAYWFRWEPPGHDSYTLRAAVTADYLAGLPAVEASRLIVLGPLGPQQVRQGAIGTGAIADGAVTSAKIADGTIVDVDIAAAAAIGWSKVDKGGSSLADLAARSAADLDAGTLDDARLSANVPRLDAANAFAAAQTFAAPLVLGSNDIAGVPCDAAARGQLRMLHAAPGSADLLYLCMKSAADTYAWVTVASG